ncbi:nucleoside-diphosphate sugar epimerase/dehydratase, partial [Polymorphobacter multimanifer]|uniref:nucleoside-diphosphate sugar epimerase/dehydratase n=1 Tax=Polymorphobacter multimanifer TaxID=1070431 RepID=UPI001A9C5219
MLTNIGSVKTNFIKQLRNEAFSFTSGVWSRVQALAGRRRSGMACDLMLLVLGQIALLQVVLNWKNVEGLGLTIAGSVIIAFIVLLMVGAHRHVWGRISLQNVMGLLIAAVLVALATATLVAMQVGMVAFSRVLLGGTVMYVCCWSAPRLMLRLWLEWQGGRNAAAPAEVEPVLVYGSRRRAEQFIKMAADGTRYRVVGFLHDNRGLAGKRLQGVDSAGSLEMLGATLHRLRAKQHDVKRLIVAGDIERPDELAAALAAAAEHGLLLCRLPSLLSLVEPSRLGDAVKAKNSIQGSRAPAYLHGKTV